MTVMFRIMSLASGRLLHFMFFGSLLMLDNMLSHLTARFTRAAAFLHTGYLAFITVVMSLFRSLLMRIARGNQILDSLLRGRICRVAFCRRFVSLGMRCRTTAFNHNRSIRWRE
jgi:hypothetical protein